ncbi:MULTISPECIES: ABC transporter ATP-binding protein [unclassified Mycoplasma]|uniref:ABC transporter ATP-binding protein n=1 Tax=unclassified Mycoplasma TaxID=2683645 RepID=UPI00216B56F1|nr:MULTISPECIES: ABC transporter ATP-binding protein [unclassified Mycoplasma]MCS4536605.1 ABC transporter ATP-binding protein [Mycoplasma sp. CSL7475-4]MCT4469575.1 ABC transporter ATP-binding protein [Mycoplasma sp. HS2188]
MKKDNFKDNYPLISVKNLKFKYNRKQQHDDIRIDELKIPSNKIVSLLGPSGSGKTTLLNLFLGFLKPTDGEIIIRNNPKIHETAYIMQENAIYENITAFDNIFLSAKNYQKWIESVRVKYFDKYFSENINYKLLSAYWRYANALVSPGIKPIVKKIRYFKIIWQILFNFKAMKFKDRMRMLRDLRLKNLFKNDVEEVAEKLGIKEILYKNVNDLSGGQKQRVAFAKGIIKRTNLVFMDEPFSALDAKIKESTIEWLLKIRKEFNLTIVIVTHDQHDALKISDRIILLNKGQLQQYSDGKNMYDNPANLFVAKFIGSPEINFIETKNGLHYYIRQNKMQLKAVKNGKYRIIDSKHFGDTIHYWIEVDENNTWVVVLKDDEEYAIGQRVNVKYLNSDVLVFDADGERVYSEKI